MSFRRALTFLGQSGAVALATAKALAVKDHNLLQILAPCKYMTNIPLGLYCIRGTVEAG